jgi:hypothetical protein
VKRSGLGVGVAASVLAHGAITAALASLVSARLPARPTHVPLSVVEAPEPPAPPRPPAAESQEPRRESAEPAKPEPKPRPKPKPKPRPAPPPDEVALVPDGGVADAGVEDAGAGDAGVEDAGLEGAGLDDARPGDGPTPLVAGAGEDAGVTGPVDPGVVDLRPFVPGGARAVLLLRTDRLKGTPWAARVEAIVAPMPDYRALLEGTGLGLAETFDLLVISSPQPRDVTQTFLAARTPHDADALRRTLDRRRRIPGDPRLIVSPRPAWFLLVRPELVDGARPQWLDLLARIEEVTGSGPTVAVVTAADLGPELVLPVPGLPPLPAPERLTVAVSTDERGLVVTGAAVFGGDDGARGFAEAVERARARALGGITGKLVLRSLHVEGAVSRLAVAREGSFVTFSTSLTAPEAELVLEQAAGAARRFFLGETP